MDRYFYSIELDENGNKIIHMSGNVYHNDGDETETCYRIAEWTFLYIPIEKAKQMCQDVVDAEGYLVFEDFLQERVSYLEDITEIEAQTICKRYFNGNPGTELCITDITDITPCGDYWFE